MFLNVILTALVFLIAIGSLSMDKVDCIYSSMVAKNLMLGFSNHCFQNHWVFIMCLNYPGMKLV